MTAILAAILFAALVGPTVIMPLPDPVLPTGPLTSLGLSEGNAVYVEAGSWVRSDIPDLVDGTLVIVVGHPAAASAPAVYVSTLWIDCRRHLYRMSPGPAYDGEGRQVLTTPPIPDRPITAGYPVAVAEAAFCRRPFALDGLPTVADWRAALAARPS